MRGVEAEEAEDAEAEAESPPLFPKTFRIDSPVLEITEDTEFARLPKIWAFICPLFGGRLDFFFWRVSDIGLDRICQMKEKEEKGLRNRTSWVIVTENEKFKRILLQNTEIYELPE